MFPALSCNRLLFIGIIVAIPTTAAAQTADSLRVMTYNIYLGGDEYGPITRTIGVINAAKADVIGLQEAGPTSNVQAIATALGFHYHRFNSDIAFISRYPIASVLSQGIQIQLSPTQQAYVFNVHLQAYPYQPYDIRDGFITTEAQVIAEAQSVRGPAVATLLNNMSSALASGAPVFLTGDFNEPSHLDWTEEAAAAGLHFGMKVSWPTATTITNAGLVDAFRELRPDEINDPGDTWTPGDPPPDTRLDEVHDRIDFVYYAGENVAPTRVHTLGYDVNDGSTDIGIQPYPSDHRAVVAEFALNGDFNRDDIVDAADYVVWRKMVDAQSAYDLWQTDFGDEFGSGSLNGLATHGTADGDSTVPEPSAAMWTCIILASIALTARKSCNNRAAAKSSKRLPELRRSHSRHLTKSFGEMTLIKKAGAVCNRR